MPMRENGMVQQSDDIPGVLGRNEPRAAHARGIQTDQYMRAADQRRLFQNRRQSMLRQDGSMLHKVRRLESPVCRSICVNVRVRGHETRAPAARGRKRALFTEEDR